MSDESEMWAEFRKQKKERQKARQEEWVPKDKALLARLKGVVVLKIENDGSGGEKYVINVNTERGDRLVDWWTSTGRWKVRKGTGEGVGLYRMARYFRLTEGNDRGSGG